MWERIDICLERLPATIAVTQREYDKVHAGPQTTNVIYDDGQINSGGVQVISGGGRLFRGMITWLKERVNEGVGGAVGSGLWAATAALLLR